ncbi:hypothetical protein VTK56DRAFT_373 [Thermocarpiscus australiensis]
MLFRKALDARPWIERAVVRAGLRSRPLSLCAGNAQLPPGTNNQQPASLACLKSDTLSCAVQIEDTCSFSRGCDFSPVYPGSLPHKRYTHAQTRRYNVYTYICRLTLTLPSRPSWVRCRGLHTCSHACLHINEIKCPAPYVVEGLRHSLAACEVTAHYIPTSFFHAPCPSHPTSPLLGALRIALLLSLVDCAP